jgi:cystathionine beta-lyase/cystathionine gamma-synthase
VSLLMKVLDPMGVAVRFADVCDLDALRAAVAEAKPGCIVMETISNPLLRVGQIDRIAEIARQAGAALVVDNTFATPLLCRPLEMGANFSVHSVTKYLAGHGDVLGGIVVSDRQHYEGLRALSRVVGPVLGPFECYLTMRGIKTFALRMERQCANACRVASWLSSHPRVEKRLLHRRPRPSRRRHHPPRLPREPLRRHGQLRNPRRRPRRNLPLHGRLKMIVRATSLGDVHTMMLYPFHELAPRDLAQAPRAHGHPRQPGAPLGGHRSGRGHHRRSGAGARDLKFR